MTDDQPSAARGKYNEIVGGLKETYGAAVGSKYLEDAGRDQAAQGQVEQKAVQTQAFVEGVTDRIGGKTDRLMGIVTGDKELERQGEQREAAGKAQGEGLVHFISFGI
ncbi:hypothetical protein OIV83_003098 [Microbotryomycetes sp. JL201]|nr:hypothetical protein OIV83_003098 [Microbotryomycetes sp. JL201]